MAERPVPSVSQPYSRLTMTQPALTTDKSSNTGKWMALVAAILGWMFDGFEMGLFPLTGREALTDLLTESKAGLTPEQIAAMKDTAKAAADKWFGVIMAVFLIGAATGGVVFGWLGDKIGRVRAMSMSIFTFAIFSGLCGFAQEAWHIAVLRFIASLGMGGEWSLGVALVTEIWSGKSRAFVAGLIGAAANVGFLLCGIISIILRENLEPNAPYPWRALMISGAVPALFIFFIRIFVPESEKWQHEKNTGSTSHWQTSDLLGVLGGCVAAGAVIVVWSPAVTSPWIQWPVTVVGVIIAMFGYMYPVKRYLFRADAAAVTAGTAAMSHGGETGSVMRRLLLGAGLTGVALMGTWGTIQWMPAWTGDLSKAAGTSDGPGVTYAKEYVQIVLAIGAVIGTIIAAVVADRFGRRITYTLMCLGSFGACQLLFREDMTYGWRYLWLVFLAGGMTASFYGFFPFYLPELFRTRIRATSQGFAFNFGRVLAAIGALQTANLKAAFDGSFARAGAAMAAIYFIGVIIIWFGPETKGRALPE